MSSNILNAMKNLRQNLHNVGNLNNWSKKVLNQGAVVINDDIDNFELVELGFSATGERTCKSLSDSTVAGHLIATPEDYMQGYETISSFFNGVGEMARIVRLEPGVRFECSNYSVSQAALDVNPIKNGQRVHYNHATKKFVISNAAGGGADAGYQTAANKFIIVDKDCTSIDGQSVIRFEVQ